MVELTHKLRLGYTLLADDQDWDFGSLRDYFLPRQIHCRPPSDWFVPTAAVALGSRKWQTKGRVIYSRALAPAADSWIRDELLDPVAIYKLHEQDYGHILPEGETLAPALEEAYVDAHAALKEIWRPNGHLATMIRRQRIELGLGEGGIRNRKNSPTWGGQRKAGAAEGRTQEEVDAETDEHADHDEAPGHERGDRGPVIGVHVPLSDKKPLWLADMAEVAITGQSYANVSVLVEGAGDAVRRLSKSSVAEPGYSRTQASFRPEARATLLVMTSEAAALSALAASSLAHEFALQQTSRPPAEELKQWKDLLRMEGEEAEAGGDERSDVLLSWRQSKFNKLPRSLRVHLTRYFLRDLTTLSLHADAFVVRGQSTLLGVENPDHQTADTLVYDCRHEQRRPLGLPNRWRGTFPAHASAALECANLDHSPLQDAVIGPRDISGHGLGGRIRSVDAPWYPTSQLSSLYAKV